MALFFFFFFFFFVRANHVTHGMFQSTCEKKIPFKELCGTSPGVNIPGQGEDSALSGFIVH